MVLGKTLIGQMPPRKNAARKITPRKIAPRKIAPMKFFREFFLISNFFFHENFCP